MSINSTVCHSSTARPIFLHMMGIPGAGKTTFLASLQQLWPFSPAPVLVGFDQVMQAMPAYQAMEDKVAAFAAFELPAREAGYAALNDTILKRIPILFDNGGSAASHLDILSKAKAAGYRLVMVHIRSDIGAAQKRVGPRAVAEGRHTPMAYLVERAEKLAVLEADYRKIVPDFYTLENNGQDFDDFQKKCVELATSLLHDLAE